LHSGHVNSYAARWAAQDAAQSVAGVRPIANEIAVKLTGDGTYTDPEIAEAALNALKGSAWVPDAAIKLAVHDGWIRLDGQVAYWYQKDAAERTLIYLHGVKGIWNTITVKPQVSVACKSKNRGCVSTPCSD
jgi:osmotically-inducible protein OsmY